MDLDFLINLEKGFETVFFNEKEHSYTIDSEPARASVTQFLKKYEESFDVNKISKIVAAKQGILVEDVVNLWDFKREYACHKGTLMHQYIESVFLRKKAAINKDQIFKFVNKFPDYVSVDQYYEDLFKLLKNFHSFYKWWKTEHILIKTELVIGDKETKICGCLDNLSFNIKSKKIVIFDYKSNKDMESESKGKLLKELNHLDNSKTVKYSLQLHLYKKIIERNTNLKVEDLYIVWMNGNQYELISPMNLEKEIDSLLLNLN